MHKFDEQKLQVEAMSGSRLRASGVCIGLGQVIAPARGTEVLPDFLHRSKTHKERRMLLSNEAQTVNCSTEVMKMSSSSQLTLKVMPSSSPTTAIGMTWLPKPQSFIGLSWSQASFNLELHCICLGVRCVEQKLAD